MGLSTIHAIADLVSMWNSIFKDEVIDSLPFVEFSHMNAKPLPDISQPTVEALYASYIREKSWLEGGEFSTIVPVCPNLIELQLGDLSDPNISLKLNIDVIVKWLWFLYTFLPCDRLAASTHFRASNCLLRQGRGRETFC